MFTFPFIVSLNYIHHITDWDAPVWHKKVVAGFYTLQEAYDYCNEKNKTDVPMGWDELSEYYHISRWMDTPWGKQYAAVWMSDMKVNSGYYGPIDDSIPF